MKLFTTATFLSILSLIASETIYVTQTHLYTVYGDEAGSVVGYTTVELQSKPSAVAAQAKLPAEGNADSSSSSEVQTPTPTTLATSVASKEESSTEAASTLSSTSDDSDDSIYSEISDSDGVDKDFAKSILDAHNEKRAEHSAGKLSWKKELFDYAQAYADKYDCSGSLVHSGGKYGENLACGYKTGVKALEAWYSEGDNYDYSSYPLDHFTQVIWKDTTELGCAYKDCSSKNWGKYVICSYNPAGNVVGKADKNVLKN